MIVVKYNNDCIAVGLYSGSSDIIPESSETIPSPKHSAIFKPSISFASTVRFLLNSINCLATSILNFCSRREN
jgi:hypothetical protein